MVEELIGIEDLKKHFKIIKIEDGFTYLKLYRGQYVIKVELPFRTNVKLASLLGHILGDGCIKTGEENVYYTNKSKDLIEEFKTIIRELFGISPRENFNEKREFYEVYPPKTIARFLVLCGFPKGEKTKQVLTIPDWIKNGSNEIKSSFIRALFDDEGTVLNNVKNHSIGFGMNKKNSLLEAHKNFMEDIREILFSIGIQPNPIFVRKQPFDSMSLGFNIFGRYNLIKFLQNVGFSDQIKQQKLIRTIQDFKTHGRNETRVRILETLKEHVPLSIRELSSIVNPNNDVVWKNLHRLVKEDVVRKIIIHKRGPIEKVLWELKNNINPNNKFNSR